MTEIHERNHFATVLADFDAVRTRLQENPGWGADLLESAGDYGYYIKIARFYSRSFLGARIIDEGADSLIACGISGKSSSLVYRIEREGENRIRVTPLAYMDPRHKVALAIVLALFYIVPVLLAPLVWWLSEVQTLRSSRVYLPTFGRYLEGMCIENMVKDLK